MGVAWKFSQLTGLRALLGPTVLQKHVLANLHFEGISLVSKTTQIQLPVLGEDSEKSFGIQSGESR